MTAHGQSSSGQTEPATSDPSTAVPAGGSGGTDGPDVASPDLAAEPRSETAEAGADGAEATGADDETHRRFREALARKNAGHHASAESARTSGGVGPAEAPTQRRQFRRKSGG